MNKEINIDLNNSVNDLNEYAHSVFLNTSTHLIEFDFDRWNWFQRFLFKFLFKAKIEKI